MGKNNLFVSSSSFQPRRTSLQAAVWPVLYNNNQLKQKLQLRLQLRIQRQTNPGKKTLGLYLNLSIFVFWGCYNKAPQTGGLTGQKFIVSLSWRPEIQGEGVSRAAPSDDPEEGPAAGLCPCCWPILTSCCSCVSDSVSKCPLYGDNSPTGFRLTLMTSS